VDFINESLLYFTTFTNFRFSNESKAVPRINSYRKTILVWNRCPHFKSSFNLICFFRNSFYIRLFLPLSCTYLILYPFVGSMPCNRLGMSRNSKYFEQVCGLQLFYAACEHKNETSKTKLQARGPTWIETTVVSTETGRLRAFCEFQETPDFHRLPSL
jgi:hypothetical protein